ncbi:hypothetical protein [Thermogemmatispora tikiterensis]|uniref:Uncharacterized protein n=1 Tax=Thermogemmatispora tikiterensis TaxID=1825093 RepID=A0A328VJ72_9CHLR|nr:hypothetical protein [Thermogemmatispora tikiterensis]RAQ95830.1 hypothetical protein A4R35_09805 [Thermogemmatispora tikiterensis]
MATFPQPRTSWPAKLPACPRCGQRQAQAQPNPTAQPHLTPAGSVAKPDAIQSARPDEISSMLLRKEP